MSSRITIAQPTITVQTVIISTSTNNNRIKQLPILDIVDTNYNADRDDGPGTNGSTLY